MAEENKESSNNTIVLNDEAWEKFMKATGGAASPCFQCGSCTAVCPWGLVKKEMFSVRRIVRGAQLGLKEQADNMWLCTTCAACQAQCPRGVPIAKVMRSLRNLAWKANKVPAGLSSLMWAVYFDKNPFKLPPSSRANWAAGLNLKIFSPEDEILLYIGDMAAYDRRAQKVAKALVEILRFAGVRFGFFGEKEPGCGEEALDVGQTEYFHEIVAENAKFFEKEQVGSIVTISPHCFDVFKNYYPKYNERFKPLHYTQYLAELICSGRLTWGKGAGLHLSFVSSDLKAATGLSQQMTNEDLTPSPDLTPLTKVAFQDPCFLGRWNEVYEAPRQVLKAIPGLEFIELPRNRENGLCCGGGGGRMFLETEAGERFSDLRVKEAADAGAQVLATACPACLACMEDSAKILDKGKLKVLDVAEIVAQALSPSPLGGEGRVRGKEKVKEAVG
ncbi:MAG: (Fe-S)-binding protein [Elusimicrobia bacterium]|nr:(Fe-S)-binding protein [Elusimicrobiota bacterium]